MKFELTIETLEEIACCIVDCDLTRDEACDYAKSVVLDGVETANESLLALPVEIENE